jgi:hypothetical protein
LRVTAPAQDPARTERRRREHERQAVVFGLLIAFLAVVGLGALAVYTGAVNSPIGQPIASPDAEVEPEGPVPCLPKVKGDAAGAVPVAYSKIRVRVFNASETTGLAAAHAEVLGDRGFDVIDTGNLDHHITESELRFGVKGIRAAYTLAAQYPEMRLVLDDRPGIAVDLAVGTEWERPLAEEDVPIQADKPLENRPGCVPAKEITPLKQEEAAAGA